MPTRRFSSTPARLTGFLAAVARRFYADQGLVRASALAYASLLSIVPLLAVMFAVLKGLGVQGRLEGVLLSRLSLSPEVADTIVDLVERVNVGTLGGLGAALLLVTVVSVLGGIEASFNHVWRVARNRSPWRKLTDYLSVILLTPFLMLAAGAMTSSMQADRVLQWLLQSAYLGPVAVTGLRLVPIAINVLAIGVLYAVMPNRRGSPAAIAVGALFAGVAWHLVQLGYIHFQIGMANYNAIYGALSQLPITLVWLYVSWTVILVGAEIAALFEFGWDEAVASGSVSGAAVALHVLVRAAESFRDGGDGVESRRMARELDVGVGSVDAALHWLQAQRWLAAVEGGRSRFVLATEPERISLAALQDFAAALRAPRGCDARVRASLERMADERRAAVSGWTLADVLHDAPAASLPGGTEPAAALHG